MEETKKELESLIRNTSQLYCLILVILINVLFFAVAQTKQSCTIQDYYYQTLEFDRQIHQGLEELLSELEDFRANQ